jgi:pimeloyl-ACP methyl ester carboxylesterase
MSSSPLVLLHPFPLSSSYWSAEKESIGKRFSSVVVPDLPGFGSSPVQATPSIAGMAAEVAARLDKQGITEPVVMAGVSMGGYLAFEFLRQFPQRLAGLALISTRATADTAEARDTRMKTIEKIKTGERATFEKAVLPKLLGQTTMETNPNLVARIKTELTKASDAGIIAALQAMAARVDSTPLLAKIRCPVLVMAGTEDSFIPADESAAMAAVIPTARLELVARAGHLLNLEQPDIFSEIFNSWI